MANILDICSIPAFLEPWITRFYAALEMVLVEALGGHARDAAEIRKILGPDCTDDFLERAWRRSVVNRLEDGRFTPSDFHGRFEKWALFEGWQDLPKDIKTQLNRWELDYYLDSHRDLVEGLKAGQPRPAEQI